MKTDETLGEQQSIRLGKLRSTRDSASVAMLLTTIRQAAEMGTNLFAPIIEAVRCRATLGEIMGELKQEFGTYMAPSGF